MAGNKRGRPRVDDPKVKFDNVRLKTTTLIDLESISFELDVSISSLVQTILENETRKYKTLLGIED